MTMVRYENLTAAHRANIIKYEDHRFALYQRGRDLHGRCRECNADGGEQHRKGCPVPWDTQGLGWKGATRQRAAEARASGAGIHFATVLSKTNGRRKARVKEIQDAYRFGMQDAPMKTSVKAHNKTEIPV